MGRIVLDLSHPIEHGMTTYPGIPGPQVSDHLSREASTGSYAPGVTFAISAVNMIGNTGTYLDSPFHRYADGLDLAGLDPARLVDVEGTVIDLPEGRAVEAGLVGGRDVRGKAVLIRTGWDRHWGGADYGHGAPYVTAEAARALAAGSPALVGIDSVNIDDPGDPARPAHSVLLAAGIPIVEHLCGLDRLPGSGFRFTAVPAPMVGVTSFPVRALAVLVD